MKRNFLAAVAVGLAIFGASAGAATSLASAGLGYTVTDLQPDDGITPSIEAETAWTSIFESQDGCCGGPGPAMIMGFLDYPAFDFAGPYGDADPAALGGGSLSATAYGDGVAEIGESAYGEFLVSPYTSVTFTFSTLLSATPGHGSASSSICIFSDSNCTGFVSGAGPDSHEEFLTYTNDTANDASVYLSAEVFAFATGVPEPTSGALMSVGLCVLLARRFKRA